MVYAFNICWHSNMCYTHTHTLPHVQCGAAVPAHILCASYHLSPPRTMPSALPGQAGSNSTGRMVRGWCVERRVTRHGSPSHHHYCLAALTVERCSLPPAASPPHLPPHHAPAATTASPATCRLCHLPVSILAIPLLFSTPVTFCYRRLFYRYSRDDRDRLFSPIAPCVTPPDAITARNTILRCYRATSRLDVASHHLLARYH